MDTLLAAALALKEQGQIVEALEAARLVLSKRLNYGPALTLINELESILERMSEFPTVRRETEDTALLWSKGQIVERRWQVFGTAEGGMGHVSFVLDREWGLELAVKTLLPNRRMPPVEYDQLKALFRRETQTWLDLGGHPHVVSGFYTLEVGGALRFFMEYVPGRSLGEVIRRRGRLPILEALNLVLQLASGMEYVHARGVVHRDLKPQNCLVTDDDTLRVTDFGLGKLLQVPDAPPRVSRLAVDVSGLSMRGIGTWRYMAPEQWHSLAAAQQPADVYAFGVMLYELLCGEVPFDERPQCWQRYADRLPPRVQRWLGADPRLVLRLFHEEVAPLPLERWNIIVPAPLAALVLCCLEKEPTKRPSFRLLQRVLLDIYTDVSGGILYTHELPGGLQVHAAGENNRAVSYYIMDNATEARSILDSWLASDPDALYPWLNRQIIALNSGERTPADVGGEFFLRLMPVHSATIEADPAVAAIKLRLSKHVLLHEAPVLALTISADSRFLLTKDRYDKVRLFCLESGALVSELEGDAVFSPDGRLLLTGGEHKEPKLWDARTAKYIRTFAGLDKLGAAAISPNGLWAILSSPARSVGVWDVESGQVVRTLAGPGVVDVAISPDGHGVATSSIFKDRSNAAFRDSTEDRAVRLWDPQSGTLLHALDGHRQPVDEVTFSPDGMWLLSESRFDGESRLWNWRSGQLHCTLQGHVTFSPDARTVLVVGHDTRAQLFDVLDRQSRAPLEGPPCGVGCATFSPDGRLVLFGGSRGSFRAWAVLTGKLVHTFVGHSQSINSVAVSPDGRFVVSGSRDQTVRRFELNPVSAPIPPWPSLVQRTLAASTRLRRQQLRSEQIRRLGERDLDAYYELQDLRRTTPGMHQDFAVAASLHAAGWCAGVRRGLRGSWVAWHVATGAPVTCVTFSHDGRWIGIGSGDGTARLLDVRSGAIVRRFATQATEVRALALNADGTLGLLGLEHGSICLVEARSGRVVQRSRIKGAITCIALSRDGSLGAIGCDTEHVSVFGMPCGDKIAKLPVASGEPLAFSPDQRYLLTRHEKDRESCRVWEVSTARVLSAFRWVGSRACSVPFTPDGRLVLTGDPSRPVSFWRATPGNSGGASMSRDHLSYSSDGEMALALREGDSLLLLDPRNATSPRLLERRPVPITAFAFSPDGHYVLTGDQDGELRLWVLDHDWAFLSEVLTESESFLTLESKDFDGWLELWCDLSRCMNTVQVTAEQHSRVTKVQHHILDALAATAVLQNNTLGPYSDPLARVSLIDKELKIELAKRMRSGSEEVTS